MVTFEVGLGLGGSGLVSESYMCGGWGDEGEWEWVDGVCASCGEVGEVSEDYWGRMVCDGCGCCNF